MEIRAAVLTEPNQDMTIQTLQLDEPAADELVVKVTSAGVCHTDIGVQAMVALPAVLGHEGCGIVAQVGSGISNHKVGDRVALTFGSCGTCPSCSQTQPAYCYQAFETNFSGLNPHGKTTLSTLDGQAVHGSFFAQSSFASHALVTERNAIVMPDDGEHKLMGPLGCGVQTGAGTLLNVLQAQSGSSFVCIGVGAVGLSAIMAARLIGCETIIAVDPNSKRLALATELGATHTLAASDKVAAEVQQITSGGADYSFDTAGTQQTFHQVLECLHIGGHAAVANVPDWENDIPIRASALAMGRTISGVLEGGSIPEVFIPQLFNWYKDGKFPIDRLHTFYEFAEINKALEDLAHGRVIKPILIMD